MSKNPYDQPKPPLGVGTVGIGAGRTKNIRMSVPRYRELLKKVRDMYPLAQSLIGYPLGRDFQNDITKDNPVRYFVCGDAKGEHPLSDGSEGFLTVSMIETNNVYPVVFGSTDDPAASVWQYNVFVEIVGQVLKISPSGTVAFDINFTGKWGLVRQFENGEWWYTNDFGQRIVLLEIVDVYSSDLLNNAT